MPKIKCSWAYDENEDGSPKHHCDFRGKDGYCTKDEIEVKNGDEGYALYEPCCQSEETTITE